MSNKKDSLGDRMKGYENIPRNYLTRRIPVIIRLDGKAFHTFTKGMRKPFDRVLMTTMQDTMKYLCENIQGCVFGYTQSDEITLVLTDYKTLTTDAWFGYNIQKVVSVAASMATMAFNKFLHEEAVDYANTDEVFSLTYSIIDPSCEDREEKEEMRRYLQILNNAIEKGALFDARVFSIPKEEVCNCLIWRQQDATRNSIEAVGQAYFSHKELDRKSCNMIQEMLWQEKRINWNDFPTDCKRGSACYRKATTGTIVKDGKEISFERNGWVVDVAPPVFTQDRDYIEKWL